MNNKVSSTSKKLIAVSFALGFFISSLLAYWVFTQYDFSHLQTASDSDEPLYWVAPMDSNYRRDKPGKSPMGMDLVPVYADDVSNDSSDQGSIYISPAVENNLGVKTVIVKKRQLTHSIRTVGYIQYNEDRLLHIHPRVAGWVEELFVKAEGDPIKKGQPVYTLYSPTLVNAQEEYLLAIKRKNSSLIKAAESRLNALKVPSYVIEQIKNNQVISQTITFYSQQSGVVDNLNIRQGFFVNPGTTIMSIATLDEVWVEAEIFERQAPWIKKQMNASMTLGYFPGKTWLGKVDYIYPTLDPKTRTLKVRLKFNNAEQMLKPNMFAEILIRAKAPEAQLIIPKQSLIRTGDQDRVVLALGEGKFKSVAVNIGKQNGEFVEVLSGLELGDTVVTSAQFLIDSESSKTSDFMRMDASNRLEKQTAITKGVINDIDYKNRQLNISREAISKWNRQAATLDFVLSDSLDINAVKENQTIVFTFEVDDEFTIVDWLINDLSAMQTNGEK